MELKKLFTNVTFAFSPVEIELINLLFDHSVHCAAIDAKPMN